MDSSEPDAKRRKTEQRAKEIIDDIQEDILAK
jgi:hypothetical protein